MSLSAPQKRFPSGMSLACLAALLSVPLWAELAQAQATSPWEYAYTAPEFADGVIRDIFCDIVGLMQGPLGALLMSAAGVMAIGGAAFGDFRSAKSGIIVAVSAATLAAGISLYFGDFQCQTRGQPVDNADNNAPADQANDPVLDTFTNP